MKAAVWSDYGKIEIKEVPIPSIGEGEVLLKVRAAGVCITDLHVYTGQFIYGRPPQILGHEICAEVVEMGKNASGLKIGQRVVVETSIGCGHCRYCRSGSRHLCGHMTEIGFTPNHGGYAQYMKAPAANLFPVPDAMTDDEAAILESVVCPAGALMRWGVRFGETVVVYGVGPAGLAFIQTARALGAGKVIAVARNRRRLERSLEFGADVIISTEEEDAAERIREITGGEGPGLICEATGAPGIMESVFDTAGKGGRIIFYGLPSEGAQIRFPASTMIMKQLEVYGAVGNPLVWEPLMTLISNGRINLKDMVTHRYSLERIDEAFALLLDREQDPVKAVVYPWS